jgi:CBS domain-containing protein
MVKQGCDLKDAQVSTIMVTEPVVADADDSVDYARDVMTKSHIGHLPILDGNKLLGIISFHDVARACLKEANFENSLLKRYIKHWPE